MVADTEARVATPERAAGALLRAFRAPERPPLDSLAQWLYDNARLRVAQPVVGTVEALIATGDLNLIRDDSLRSAITAYAQAMEATTLAQQQWAERERTARVALNARVDFGEVRVVALSPDALDSLAQARPIRGIVTGAQRRPFPFTVEAVLTDRAAYDAVVSVSVAKQNMEDYRDEMLRETQALRRRVDAQFSR